jgi:hypothetical protein
MAGAIDFRRFAAAFGRASNELLTGCVSLGATTSFVRIIATTR